MAVQWEVPAEVAGEQLQQAAGAAFGGEVDDSGPTPLGRRLAYAWALAMVLVGLYVVMRHAQ